MGFLIVLVTVVLVLVCVFLVFLVLLQLPKKEAGAGLAFGGGATDALFGAGAGNVLTKITKYAATTFFVLAVVLSLMKSWDHNRRASSFTTQLSTPTKPSPVAPTATTVPPPAPKPAASGTNAMPLMTPTTLSATNATVSLPTNPTPEAPK